MVVVVACQRLGHKATDVIRMLMRLKMITTVVGVDRCLSIRVAILQYVLPFNYCNSLYV